MALIQQGYRILCLSPHPDDAEFGVGATLHKYSQNCQIRLIVCSDRSRTRGEKNNERDQAQAAARIGLGRDCVHFIDQLGLGVGRLPIRFFGTEENRDVIRLTVTRIIQDFDPDLIFVPSLHETMQDHQALAQEVVRVIRGRAAILGYEVPKHNRFFRPQVFVSVSEADLAAKIAALHSYSEFTNTFYFQEEVIKSLARIRALNAGFLGFCEAFELYRLVDNQSLPADLGPTPGC